MRRIGRLWIVPLLFSLVWVACGRALKTTSKVHIPTAYDKVQEMGREELVEMVNTRYASIGSLTVSDLSFRFQGGSMERGYLEKYPKAKAYFVTQRPDKIYVNILNPVTKSTLVAMASEEGSFQIWVPRENKYLTGLTDVRIESENPLHHVRPAHLIPAILIEPIPSGDPNYRYFVKEDQDQDFKYYVLGVVELEAGSRAVQLRRKLWFERSSMNLVRQQYYDEGALISSMRYRKPLEVVGRVLNSEIRVERKHEHYEIQLDLDSRAIEVDRAIREGIFQLPQPPGAELVTLSRDERQLEGLNPSGGMRVQQQAETCGN